MVKSILITGTDYTGKTTLMDSLFNIYSKRGLRVNKNKFDLVKTPIFPIIEQLMNEDWEKSKLVVNSLLAATFMIDGVLFKPEGDIFIQDSYFHRTMAFCAAYNIPHINNLLETVTDKLYHFDVNILLYASIDAKRSRAQRNGKFDMFDRAIYTSPDLVRNMDEILENIVKKETNYIKIDTSNLSILQVLNEAMEYIEKVK